MNTSPNKGKKKNYYTVVGKRVDIGLEDQPYETDDHLVTVLWSENLMSLVFVFEREV